MDLQIQTRRVMEQDLRRALPAGEFELYYQPVVNLASNEVSGFEALIRWNHPETRPGRAGRLHPAGGRNRLHHSDGRMGDPASLRHRGALAGRLRVAVNISAAQFRNSGLLQIIVGALAASGLPPTRLEIEITETVLLQNRETTLAVLHQLRALGIRIAMDDFGTGYSSLTYLQSFPFDKIKIDRSFVKDITTNTGSLNIVRAVAALANGMGMTATAEGVETHEQLAQIVAAGCTEMQGYLFSQPLPGGRDRGAVPVAAREAPGQHRRGLTSHSRRHSGERETSGIHNPIIANSGFAASTTLALRNDETAQNSRAIFASMPSNAARLAGPSNSLSRASCLLATSFLARASTARPLSVSTRMCERRSLVERIRVQRSRLSSPSSIATKFGRRMPSVLAISVWLRPGFLSISSNTENCAGVSCSGATQRKKSSNTFSCARLSE